MDFDLARFIMIHSLKAPGKLYQHTKRLKQISGQWHRDDPCIVAALIVLLFIAGILYGIYFGKTFLFGYIYLSLKFILINFILSGCLIGFACKTIAEMYMVKADKGGDKSEKNEGMKK